MRLGIGTRFKNRPVSAVPGWYLQWVLREWRQPLREGLRAEIEDVLASRRARALRELQAEDDWVELQSQRARS